MIPCKFFLRGTCRYGDNCRFSHQTTNEYPSNPFGGGRQMNPVAMSNFANYSQQQQNNYGQQNNYSQQAQQHRTRIDETLKAIEDAVKKDMVEWERGKIWPFSSYGPIGGKPNLPGFEDLSAEELRYATLQNNGQPPPEIAMRFSQWNAYRSNYQMINPTIRQLLQQISMAQPQQQQQQQQHHQQSSQLPSSSFQPSSNVPSIFGGAPSYGGAGASSSAFGGGNNQQTSQFIGMNPTSNFPSMNSNFFGLNKSSNLQTEQMEDTGPVSGGGSALPQFSFNQVLSQTQQQQQQPQPSVFGTPGPFGTSQSLVQSQNPSFGGSPQFPAFQMNQPSPMQNMMGSNTMPSGFDQMAPSFPQSNTSTFGMPQQPQMANPGMMNSKIFGGGGSGGGGDAIEEDFSIYSKDTELTDLEIRAYEHTTFDIENLPLHAPSKRFCC